MIVEWLILLLSDGIVEHASIIKAETKEEAMAFADQRLADVPWCEMYIMHSIKPHPKDIVTIKRVAEQTIPREPAKE